MKIKIPTLLGLLLLIVAIGLGIILDFYRQDLKEKKLLSLKPKKLEVVNISDSSATITWQTEIPTTSEVFLLDGSSTVNRYDDRDLKNPKKRQTHFFTFYNLRPDTSYNYIVKYEGLKYEDSSQQFKTAPKITGEENKTDISLNPIQGNVVDANLQAVEGALIFLETAGASKIATYTNKEGNFILPLKNLRTENLKERLKLSENTNASLLLQNGISQSIIEITLPLKDVPLSSLPLGRNVNLRNYIKLSLEKINEKTVDAGTVKFDLNGDGKLNSLDLSIVVQSFGKKRQLDRADFNADNSVDQKDIEIMKNAI